MKFSLDLLSLVLLLVGVARSATGPECDFAAGRAYYSEGQFREAATHFELALKTNPEDAASHYWAGRSYEVLADVAAPLGHKYRPKARLHLSRAAALAPAELEYRRELFHFLLDSGGWREAAAIIRSVGEADPEYEIMLREFGRGRRVNSSAEARLGSLFLAAPRAVYRFVEAPLR
jgi:tetratricopeptide (TPR) repeat protein